MDKTMVLKFKNGFTMNCSLLSETENYYYGDNEGISVRVTKGTNEIHNYDCYNNEWKLMKGQTELLDAIEII